ncbi:VOC family protein, partial [Acidobacteria bacterium AH-259-D05]|nr:VOC family protein [Acidobacteria bacterium AH-259-D05]
MRVNLYKVVFPVSDIDQAETFYRQLLNVSSRRVSPRRINFDCGGMILTCYVPDADGSSSKVSSCSHQVSFAVENLEGVYEQAKHAGCAFLDEQISIRPWGNRSFMAEDPFGNSIIFVDGATMQRQMDERLSAGPDNLLKVGLAISVQSLKEESTMQQFAASVAKI